MRPRRLAARRHSAIALCLAVSTAAGAAAAAPRWSYSGADGPDRWAAISNAFATCGSGHQQSPIDLSAAVSRDLANPQVAYQPSDATIVDNGHAVEVDLGRAGNILTLDGVPYALVDTGWSGRIVKALDENLPADATPLRRVWFFGYMKRSDGHQDPSVVKGYLFDEVAETGYHGDFEQAYGPLETFTVANHGVTVGFRRTDGRIEPVLASPTNPTLADWPWDLYREAVFRFVDELVLDGDIAQVHGDLRPAVADVLTEFWLHPTRSEAQAWGRYVYEDDILASSRHLLATPIEVRDFLHKTTRRTYEGKRLWLPASVALTPAYLRPQARLGLWVNERRRRGRLAFFLTARAARRLQLAKLGLRTRRR